ncbi:MAG: hypothetical protein GWN30_07650, partial [Gammaproteobacteria bacterium]|nr:hypothetical protein [Gammaproteobacteria bacterium]
FTDVQLSGISIDPELDRIRELESTHKSLWKPIVSMVVSGAVSAYYKLQANEAYDQYRRSLDQSSIQYYYDQTKKYDTYSTISFVIFQGSFGWMIYKLIR